MMKSNSLSRLEKLMKDVVSLYAQEQRNYTSLSHIDIHGYDHIYRVWMNVKKIEQHNDMDDHVNYELIQAAAMLHDIGYLAIASNNLTTEDHVIKSVLMSKNILQDMAFTEKEVDSVQEIISGHHGDPYNKMSLEQKILFIADQLDLLGLDGTLREFIRAATKNQNRDELAVEIFKKSTQRYENLVQLKISEKLVIKKWRQSEKYLKQIINTGPREPKLLNGE